MHFSTSAARKWGMFNLPALRGVKWKSKLLTVPKESTQIKSEWGILYKAGEEKARGKSLGVA